MEYHQQEEHFNLAQVSTGSAASLKFISHDRVEDIPAPHSYYCYQCYHIRKMVGELMLRGNGRFYGSAGKAFTLSNVKDGRHVPVLNELKCFFESNESNFSGRKPSLVATTGRKAAGNSTASTNY